MPLEIGENYPVNIPTYTEDADIQAALKLYHYGSYTYNENLTDPTTLPDPSIARYLYQINTDIDTLQSDVAGKIGASSFNAKGDLLVGSADNALTVLSAAANGKVLVTNSGTGSGLEWQDFPTSFTNLTAATLNVSGNAVFHIATKEITSTGNSNYLPNSGDITDDGKLLEFNSPLSTTILYKVPSHSLNPYPIGTQISILRTGEGEIAVQASDPTTTTINATPGFYLRARWSSATLIKRSTVNWVLIGDLKSTTG